MSPQPDAIARTTGLRPLPLPGRDGAVLPPPDAAADRLAQKSQQTPRDAPQGIASTTGRSAKSDEIIVFASIPAQLAQTLQFTALPQRQSSGALRQRLADEVVGFLLSAHETQHAAPSPGTGESPALFAYHAAAAGFPRSSDSLFSLTG